MHESSDRMTTTRPIPDVTVRWETPRSPSLDADFVAWLKRMRPNNPRGLARNVLAAPVLPSGEETRHFFLFAVREPTKVRWQVMLNELREDKEDEEGHDGEGDDDVEAEKKDEDSAQAAETADQSDRKNTSLTQAAGAAGGRDALGKLLRRHLGTAVGTFIVTFTIPEASWSCNVAPTRVEARGDCESALALSDEVYRENVGFRFVNGANGISGVTIMFDHDESSFVVNVHARGRITIGDRTWLPYAEDVRDVVLGTFFRSRSEVPDV
jgi:hypothetical protein